MRNPIKSWRNRAASVQRRMETIEAFAHALDECVKEDYEERLALEARVDAMDPEHRISGLENDVSAIERRMDDMETDYEA